jgi:hypothetical protein
VMRPGGDCGWRLSISNHPFKTKKKRDIFFGG